MRLATLTIAVLAATSIASPLLAQQQPLGAAVEGPRAVACGATLLDDRTAEWLTESPVRGDFTLDGQDDAVIWGAAEDELVLLVERCEGEQPAERWRFPLAIGDACEIAAARVTAASLLLDDPVVERVCAQGEQRDECIHLRRENARRQALVDAGAREIRIHVPGCPATSLVWDDRRGGFMRLPR